jgi:DNA-binding transcriptional ArsR family regulator
MSDNIRTDESRLKVYALLADGLAASKVSSITGLDKGYVSRTAKLLVQKGYLEIVKGTKSPKFYTKGPNGVQLDKVIVDSKLTVYTRGVTHLSKLYDRSETGRVHHKKYKLRVVKEGSLNYYKIGARYRNVQRLYAEIPYKDLFVKVELERSFKKDGNGTILYIYAPQMDLTSEELPQHEELSLRVIIDIANYLSRHLGWKLEEPENTNWQLHIGIDDPAMFKGLAEKIFMRSKDGKAMLSNSEGRFEYETIDSVELAQIKLDLPGEVLTIKTTTNGIVETLQQMVQAFQLVTQSMSEIAKIETIYLQTEAAKANAKLQSTEPPKDPAFASDTEDGKRSKKDVMYQ